MRLLRNYAAVGVVITAVCIFVVAFVGWSNGQTAIDDAIRDTLVTRRANRAAQVGYEVDRIAAEVATLAADPSIQGSAQAIVDSLDEIESAMESASISPETESALTDWMQVEVVDPVADTGGETLPANRLLPGDPIGQEMLGFGVLGQQGLLPDSYVDEADRAALDLSQRAETFDFEDLLLVDVDSGRVMLSSAGGPELGANLERGYLRNSGLAEAIRSTSGGGTGVAMADFSHHIPAGNRPSAFFAISIALDNRGPAALVARVSPEVFDRLLIDARGLAPSGLDLPVTTYVVGSDRLLRTDPVDFQQAPQDYIDDAREAGLAETTLLSLQAGEATLAVSVDTPLLDEVFIREKPALDFTEDPLGQSVLMGATEVPTAFVDWAVVAQVDRSEAVEPLRRFAIQEALLGILTVAVAGLALWWFNRVLFRPRAWLESVSASALNDDLGQRVEDPAGDEIAAASESLNQLLDEVAATEEQALDAERAAAAVLAAVTPATIDLTDGSSARAHGTGGATDKPRTNKARTDKARTNKARTGKPQTDKRRVACCLVADATRTPASDVPAVDALREALGHVRSLAVSHDMAIERTDGSSVLVSAPIDRFAEVVAYARDAVASASDPTSATGDSKASLLSGGIGCGDLRGRAVGETRLHIVVWGSAISEAHEAQEAAAPGFVALSAQAMDVAKEINLRDVGDDSQISTRSAEAKQ